MECAGRGSRSPCGGRATRRCNRCRAVAYCSISHQVSHSRLHKSECDRLQQQMKRIDVVNDFPFTFADEAAQIQEKRCSFLTRHGVHCQGMWMPECCCGVSTGSLNSSRWYDSWNLSFDLCPCKGPSYWLQERLTTWKDYYEWRCIPLSSPAALLLHWPLTIYWAIQLAFPERMVLETSNELRIHYLGPEKELLQLAVFGELLALFPGLQLRIDLVGPEIPDERNGEQTILNSYAHCIDITCQCKTSGESSIACKSGAITTQLHTGLYHDCYTELSKDSVPDLIIAPNAGIAAYTSWLPTLELIKKIKVPAIFSDYCEEACHLAVCCIRSTIGIAPRIQIQMNPFRQPLLVEKSALYLPCYSNCFLFGI